LFERNLSEIDFKSRPELQNFYTQQFLKLVHVTMREETSASFESYEGAQLRLLLNRIRAALGGPVPDPIPLLPDPGAEWETRK